MVNLSETGHAAFTGFFLILKRTFGRHHTETHTNIQGARALRTPVQTFLLQSDSSYRKKLWKLNLQSLSIFASLLACSSCYVFSSSGNLQHKRKSSGSFEFLSRVFYSLFRRSPIYLPDAASCSYLFVCHLFCRLSFIFHKIGKWNLMSRCSFCVFKGHFKQQRLSYLKASAPEYCTNAVQIASMTCRHCSLIFVMYISAALLQNCLPVAVPCEDANVSPCPKSKAQCRAECAHYC